MLNAMHEVCVCMQHSPSAHCMTHILNLNPRKPESPSRCRIAISTAEVEPIRFYLGRCKTLLRSVHHKLYRHESAIRCNRTSSLTSIRINMAAQMGVGTASAQTGQTSTQQCLHTHLRSTHSQVQPHKSD